MARTQSQEPIIPPLTSNPFARIAGRDAPMHLLAAKASAALASRAITVRMAPAPPREDYAQIDPSLSRTPPHALPAVHFQGTAGPVNGLGYVGFDAEARGRFLLWLDHPERDAPVSFQTLYLAYLESALVEAVAAEKTKTIEQIIATLRALEVWPHWMALEQRARTLLFAFLLMGDGALFGSWLAEGRPTPAIVGVALGCQALLGAPLTATEVLGIARVWDIADDPLDAGVVALRLRSLTETMGVDPLTFAMQAAVAQAGNMPDVATAGAKAGRQGKATVDVPATMGKDGAGEGALTLPNAPSIDVAASAVKPWRSAHRDLRVEFAQLELKPWLAPLLAELLDDVPAAALPSSPESTPALDADDDGKATRDEWAIILEFGQSHSEYFDYALKQAQRLPGYSALVDEHRHVIHRVLIRKTEMRRFWQLWEYVMSWRGTRVYLNGKELEKWKVYPYSQYLS